MTMFIMLMAAVAVAVLAVDVAALLLGGVVGYVIGRCEGKRDDDT